MKERTRPVILALVLIIFIIAGFIGMRLVDKYTPTKEIVRPEIWFEAEGDQVALFLNDQLQEKKGIYSEGQTYVPIDWVIDNLNQKFYWDAIEELLVYTFPDKIVYADAQTMGSSGKPLLLVQGETVYLTIGLISSYTDIRVSAYDGGEVKRIYVDNTWDEEQTAVVKKSEKVRKAGGIKSPILTEVLKGSQVRIVEEMEDWSKVMTEDGYIGYVKNNRLSEITANQPVSSFEAPVYTSTQLDEKVNMVWHPVFSMKANEGLEERLSQTKGINVIAPTWFALMDNEGNYQSFASKEYVDKAHSMGIQVWPVLDNFNYNYGKDVNTRILMGPTSNRKKLIDKLMADADYYGFDGINLDFETLKDTAGPYYVQFIRELSVACRQKGLILSVDNPVPAAYNMFYNRAEQGRVADYVIIMGYDEHYSGGEAGSVASLGFVEQGIVNTLKEVPKEKVINGIPFYTRVWTIDGETTTSEAYGIAGAQKWVDENQVELHWQEELGQSYGELETEEGLKKIWLEDEESIKRKMEVIKNYDIAGVASWRLGFETPEIWDIVQVNE